jgi:hypothetical protein
MEKKMLKPCPAGSRMFFGWNGNRSLEKISWQKKFVLADFLFSFL